MLNAIKGLIGSPQNNLKLCKNGRIVYDEQQDKSVFNRILKDIFPRDGRTKEEYIRLKRRFILWLNTMIFFSISSQEKNSFHEPDKGNPAERFLQLRGGP